MDNLMPDQPTIAEALESVELLRSKLVSLGNGTGTFVLAHLRVIECALKAQRQPAADLAALVPIGRMFLDALSDDPMFWKLQAPEGTRIAKVRDAVERGERA